MKSLRSCFLFSTGSLLVFVLLSYLFQFPLVNSWQAGVWLLFFFGPYWLYFWRMTNTYKEKYPFFCVVGKVYLTLLLMAYIFASVFILIYS